MKGQIVTIDGNGNARYFNVDDCDGNLVENDGKVYAYSTQDKRIAVFNLTYLQTVIFSSDAVEPPVNATSLFIERPLAQATLAN